MRGKIQIFFLAVGEKLILCRIYTPLNKSFNVFMYRDEIQPYSIILLRIMERKRSCRFHRIFTAALEGLF